MQTYKDNFHTQKKTNTELERRNRDYKEKQNFGKSMVGQEGHSSGGGKEEGPAYISTLKSKVEIYCYGNRILYWVWV